jgi:hypothetical protein
MTRMTQESFDCEYVLWEMLKKKDINFRKAVIFEENVLGLTVVRQICFVFTILQFSLSFYQTLHTRAMKTL